LISTLAVDDVINVVRRLPDKYSAADPTPTPIPKQVADLFAPIIVTLFNRSLASAGHFPVAFRERLSHRLLSGTQGFEIMSRRI
jgi:hypothetical protein